MMRTIWKYGIDLRETPAEIIESTPVFGKDMPVTARPITVIMQSGAPVVYVEVDDDAPTAYLPLVAVVGTGMLRPWWIGDHLATLPSGPFVWHYYRPDVEMLAYEPGHRWTKAEAL